MVGDSSFKSKQIGSYRIVAELRSGAYGRVFQGKHVIFDDDPIVAIKMLHAYLNSEKEHEQFIREAQLLKKLKHPHILPVLDAGLQENVPYLVTEYAPGGSLYDRLKQRPGEPLPLHEVIKILAQIGQALQYVHQQHIVHRDLKPENILFNTRGEALLADFGIAIILATARTREIGMGGTPVYMAPEQFEGTVSTKSDQYTLGCIAYELVTGRKPFTVPHPSLEAIWYQHAKVNPDAPRQLNPLIPEYIEQALLKAMAKDRVKRFPDVATFIAALLKPKQQWLHEGNMMYELQWYREALAAYTQAQSLQPGDASAINGIGAVNMRLNEYKLASSAFEQAMQLQPDLAPVYSNMGYTLLQLRSSEQALAVLEQALQLDPRETTAYNNKAYILCERRRYAEAYETLKMALSIDPDDPRIYKNMGITLDCLGKSRDAQQAYDRARQLGYTDDDWSM